MNTKSRLLVGSILAAPLLALAAPAAAQQTPNQPDLAERVDAPEEQVIVVTGSYIAGNPEDGALPVDVFGQEELEQRGIDSPLEFIKSLPSVGAVLGDSNQYAAGASAGVGSVNLRNLGRERTLVLFNGRRFPNEPGDGAGDTNLIPLFALERVEILKDGAASTYGSDAIAGVANFVTRKNFNGFEAAADYDFVDGSDGNWKGSVLAGTDLGDSVNLMFGFGWQHRSELPSTERDFTQVPYAINPSGFSGISNPSLYIPLGGPNFSPIAAPALDGRLVDACEGLGGVEGTFSNLPSCYYNYVPFANLIEDEDRYQIYGQMSADLGTDTVLNVEALYARTELLEAAYSPSYPVTQGPNGPGAASQFIVPANNPGFADFIAQTFPALPVAPRAALVVLGRPFALGGNPTDERGAGIGRFINDAYRLTAGIEHDFSSSFGAQLYGTYIQSDREAYSEDILGSRLQRALNGFGGENCTGTTPGQNGCLFFNPFANASPGNPALGNSNPAFVPGNENNQAVIEYFRKPSGTVATEKNYIADLVFDGLLDLGGLELGYAFGGQYRKTEFVTNPINEFSDPAVYPCSREGVTNCASPNGGFTFLPIYAGAEFDQDVYALFAEARIEPFDGFEVTGAVRYEDYGGEVGSTINPKVSARWQVADFLTLRGSVGDTFRGPLPADVTPNVQGGVAGIQALGNAFIAVDTAGNPSLAPETALTYNAGAIVEFGGFSASVDYWAYEFEGRHTLLPVQQIAFDVAPNGLPGSVDCGSPFIEYVTFQGGVCDATTVGSNIARLRTQLVNGPNVFTNGLDFGINYSDYVGDARLSFGANATHILNYDYGAFVFNGLQFSEGYEGVGFTNYGRAPGVVSPWRASGYASANVGNFRATYSITYVDGVTDSRCPAEPAPCASTPDFGPTDFGREVGSFTKQDFLASYDIDLGAVTMTLQGGVENIFDEDPPAARLEYGYDPFIGSALGRTYKIGTKIKY